MGVWLGFVLVGFDFVYWVCLFILWFGVWFVLCLVQSEECLEHALMSLTVLAYIPVNISMYYYNMKSGKIV